MLRLGRYMRNDLSTVTMAPTTQAVTRRDGRYSERWLLGCFWRPPDPCDELHVISRLCWVWISSVLDHARCTRIARCKGMITANTRFLPSSMQKRLSSCGSSHSGRRVWWFPSPQPIPINPKIVKIEWTRESVRNRKRYMDIYPSQIRNAHVHGPKFRSR
jgi:hypothetical protein